MISDKKITIELTAHEMKVTAMSLLFLLQTNDEGPYTADEIEGMKLIKDLILKFNSLIPKNEEAK